MMAEQTICRHSEIWTVKRHSLRVLPTKQLVGSNIAFIDTVIYGFSLKGSVIECHIIQNRWMKRIASRREVLESLIQVFRVSGPQAQSPLHSQSRQSIGRPMPRSNNSGGVGRRGAGRGRLPPSGVSRTRFYNFIDGYDFQCCRKYNAAPFAGPSLSTYLPLTPAVALTS